jgi:hypothetical protein
MAVTISTKLTAKVIASVDLASRFEKEEITIKGIEMKSDPADPNKVRIVCSKPKTIKIPLGDVGEWTISEE